MKKILKWVLIIPVVWIALAVAVSFDDEEEESAETQTNVKMTAPAEKTAQTGLSVSDFALNKDISKALKTLRSNGWKPGDGDEGECGSGYSDFLAGYGYEKQDGRFEGYHVPFIIVSADEYGKLAHIRVRIDTAVNSKDYIEQRNELNRQEEALFEKIDDGKNIYNTDFYTLMDSVQNVQGKITPEIQAEYDEIYKKHKTLEAETEKVVVEAKGEAIKKVEKLCILRHGYSYSADEYNEDEEGKRSLVLGYKNGNGDICKIVITDTGRFTTSFTLDYVSARFRNEEKLAQEILNAYYGR